MQQLPNAHRFHKTPTGSPVAGGGNAVAARRLRLIISTYNILYLNTYKTILLKNGFLQYAESKNQKKKLDIIVIIYIIKL